jgi:hypothetical protein
LIKAVFAHTIKIVIPLTLRLSSNIGLGFLTGNASDTISAEPILRGDVSQRRIKAMDMHCFITHIANNNFVFIVVEITIFASFAIRAFPWESFY